MKRWHHIADRLPKSHRTRGVEVGVFEGRTSAELLRLVPLLSLVMVDHWRELPEDDPRRVSREQCACQPQSVLDRAMSRAIESTAFAADRRFVMREESAVAATKFHAETFDFVYLDADPTYEGTRRHVAQWFDKVKIGGFIGGHHWGAADHFAGIKPAVQKFSEDHDAALETAGGCWFLRRVA